MSLLIASAGQLKELRESSEKPENYILTPEVAATAYDQALYKRVIEYLDTKRGPGYCVVIFSITRMQKVSGGHVLVRHASFRDHEGEPNPSFVLMACQELGFRGTFDDWQLERHPQDPNIIAVAQEYQPRDGDTKTAMH